MTYSDNYNYFYYLTVSGSESDRQKVHEMLKRSDVLGKYLEARGADKKAPTSYAVSLAYGYVNEWNENQQEELLHKIALTVPNAKIVLQCETEEMEGSCYEKHFRGDLYQELRQNRPTEAHMPPMDVEKFIPFEDREKKPDVMYVLCEEIEGKDGIREFSIVGVSQDKQLLQDIMQEKIEKDQYGFIKDKGVEEHSEDSFRTNFENGFVEYNIQKEQVLTRELLRGREVKKEKDPSLDMKIDDASARQQDQKNSPSREQEKGNERN